MPEFLSDIEEVFGAPDLYLVLGVSRSCNDKALKRAYRKKALEFHPDRVNENKEEATKKFQLLGKVYSVLTDQDRRAVYDECGTVDDDDADLTQDRNWTDYWNLVFRKVTVEDIREYEDKFRGSEEEQKQLKDTYTKSKGNMDEILETVMCGSIDDEPRFHDTIRKWIEEGEVEPFDFVKKETDKRRSKRKAKWDKEAEEVKETLEEEAKPSEDSLKALIKARQESREQGMDSFLDNLAEKYAPKPKKPRNNPGTSSKTAKSRTLSKADKKGKIPKKK